MKIRHIVSTIGIFAIFTSLAIGGAAIKDTNGKSGCPDGENQPGAAGKDLADPINLSTGGFQLGETDLVIPGRGLDFEIKRYYRSFGGLQALSVSQQGINFDFVDEFRDNPVGDHWDLNYNRRISFGAPGGIGTSTPVDPGDGLGFINPDQSLPASIDVFSGTGRFDKFNRYSQTGSVGNGLYSNDQLRERLEYTYRERPVYIIDSDLTRYKFIAAYDTQGLALPYAGRLESITDRNGNQISFQWQTVTASGADTERIDYAIDTLGHTIDFVYHDELYNGQSSPLTQRGNTTLRARQQLIWIIRDHAERVVEYDYTDSNGLPTMLASVTLPSITNTSDFPLPSEHERFPTGRKKLYTYDTRAALGKWQGRMLTTITSPNGHVILENEYDITANNDRNDGRVLRQKYGNAEYNYIVTDLSGSIVLPGSSSGNDQRDDYYVWVNDRRGAITRLKYAGIQSATDPTAFHRQLLEKTEFAGFVSDPKRSTWASESGGALTWYYLDEANRVGEVHGGPVTPNAGNSTTYVNYDYPYSTDRFWNLTKTTRPNGDTIETEFDNLSDDPLRQGAKLSRTITSADLSESITESWLYDSGLGAGCGCGTQNFDTAHKDGKGYVTMKDYSSSGDLLAVYRDLPLSTSMSNLPDDPAALAAAIDRYTYNQWGQVLTHTFPSKLGLDPQGNPTTLPLREDHYEYYNDINDSNNYGRLFRKHIDANGIDLTTTYVYDAIGNVIQITEPDGDISRYLYNQAAELVQEQHFDSTGITLFAQTDYFYDANGNVVRTEVLNLDGDQQPVVGGNPSFTTINEYDIHDYLITVSREAGGGGAVTEYSDGSGRYFPPVADPEFITQKWIYDGGKNLIRFSDGEAVNGADATNVVDFEYDARDLLIKSTKGMGSSSPLVTSYAYDVNERLTDTTINPDDPTKSQHTAVVFDAFNRVVSRTDPMGNVYYYTYDDNHNPLSLEITGPVIIDDAAAAEQDVLLAKITRTYGVLDLKESQTMDIFQYNYSTGTPLASSSSQTTLYQYNEDSSLRMVDAPSGDAALRDVTSIYYDTASRIEFRQDAAGNFTQYEYDADSNISKMTQTDVASSGSGVEIYEVLYEYDALDRRVATTDGVGNRTVTKYDSRSNPVEKLDARGNTDTYTYDSLSRLTSTSMGNGIITAAKSYDASSRLISETDDNGNTTTYAYDGLNRMTRITMPDGAFYSAAYDTNNNVTTYTDARGVVVNQFFDRNNRLYQRTITGNIPGTTLEDFTYDGLGRLRTAVNDFAKITREYDSRSNVVRELQNVNAASSFPTASDRVVGYEFDNANNNNKITYPGGRVVDRTYDELNRLEGIFNDIATNQLTDPITQLDYIGRRLKSRTNGNGTQTVYKYGGFVASLGLVEIGDMGFGRVNAITTSNTNTGAFLDGFTFTWDANQNRTSYKDRQSGMKNRRERIFGYDAANRLTSTDVDYPDPMTDFVAPTNNGITTYTLDGVHNRTAVSGYEGNGAPLGSYSQSGSQAQNNQYTRSPREAGGEWDYTYDENGNLITKAQFSSVDFTGDYTIGSDDLNLFLALYAAQDPAADLNGDGSWNFNDISIFQSEFVDGAVLEHRHYTYDFRNQLVGVSIKLGPTEISSTTNTYDSVARRVTETVYIAGVTDASRQFVYGCTSLWEMIEQIDLLDVNTQTVTTHVFGLGIDDEVNYQYWDQGVLKDIWTHRDDLNSLTSITDNSGAVKERYEYGDYGKVAIFDGVGLSLPATAFEVVHLYTGRSMIAGTGLYDYRFRVMDSETGRFNQRDPLGYLDSMSMYAYVSSNPTRFLDPYGLEKIEVRYNQLGPGYYHAYIVVTDTSTGQEYYYRGGPSKGGPSSGGSGATTSGSGGRSGDSSGSDSSGSDSGNSTSPGSGDPGGDNDGPFGPIVTHSGPYEPGTIDWNPNNPPSDILKDDDDPCGDTLDKLDDAVQKIDDLQVPYNPFGPNSNSTVRELLEDIGIDPPKPSRFVPGWNTDIIPPKPPSKPKPEPYYPKYLCFVKGTSIVLADGGAIDISRLEIGDILVGYDTFEESIADVKVTKLLMSHSKETLTIFTAEDAIEVTAEHPFWVENDKWVVARELHAGMKILDIHGVGHSIDRVIANTYDHPIEIYSLSVQSPNTYAVGAGKLVVHNK